MNEGQGQSRFSQNLQAPSAAVHVQCPNEDWSGEKRTQRSWLFVLRFCLKLSPLMCVELERHTRGFPTLFRSSQRSIQVLSDGVGPEFHHSPDFPPTSDKDDLNLQMTLVRSDLIHSLWSLSGKRVFIKVEPNKWNPQKPFQRLKLLTQSTDVLQYH